MGKKKAQRVVNELLSAYEIERKDKSVLLDFERLSQIRGYLVHMGMFFPNIVPFKGNRSISK